MRIEEYKSPPIHTGYPKRLFRTSKRRC